MSFEIITPEAWAASGRSPHGCFNPLVSGGADWHQILHTLQGLESDAGIRLVAGTGFDERLGASTIQSYAHRAAKEFPGCKLGIRIVGVPEGRPAELLIRMKERPIEPIPCPRTPETVPTAPQGPETGSEAPADTPPPSEASQPLSAPPFPGVFPTAT